MSVRPRAFGGHGRCWRAGSVIFVFSACDWAWPTPRGPHPLWRGAGRVARAPLRSPLSGFPVLARPGRLARRFFPSGSVRRTEGADGGRHAGATPGVGAEDPPVLRLSREQGSPGGWLEQRALCP